MQHLLEISFYCASDFESRKVQEKSRLAMFWWFGGAMAKTGQLLPSQIRVMTDRSTKCDVFNVFFPYFGCVLLVNFAI